MSGGFWGSQEGCQGPSRPSGRNRGLPLDAVAGKGLILPRGAQSNGGAAWRLFRSGETRRGHPLGEPRLGSRAGAGEEATWNLGAGRLRARKCRLGQRAEGGMPVLHHTQITESFLLGDPMIQGL